MRVFGVRNLGCVDHQCAAFKRRRRQGWARTRGQLAASVPSSNSLLRIVSETKRSGPKIKDEKRRVCSAHLLHRCLPHVSRAASKEKAAVHIGEDLRRGSGVALKSNYAVFERKNARDSVSHADIDLLPRLHSYE